MSCSRNTDWSRSVAFAFTSGGFFGYLLRSIRPVAILTSMVTGAALGSLLTYEYFDIEQKLPADHTLSQMNTVQPNQRRPCQYFQG